MLALIINQNPYNPLVPYYNTELRAMAEHRIADGDKIVIVDMEHALNYPADLFDRLHPNQRGYGKMANVWQAALIDILPTCMTAKQP